MLAAPPVRRRGQCCEVSGQLHPVVAAETTAVLKAIADVTRLQMLAILARAQQPVCVCDFTAEFGLGQPTVSHHLGKLKRAGLVTCEKRGTWAHYRLSESLSPAVRRLLEAATQLSP